MAERPWVTPQEVKDYSEIPEVQQRADAKLAVDISRAEQYVITYTHNSFQDMEKIPEPVRTAVLLLAEAYGHTSATVAKSKVKSETFDDYSYTAEAGQIDIKALDLGILLDAYVRAVPRNAVTLRMRKL